MNGKNRNFYVGLAIVCVVLMILFKIFKVVSLLLGKILLGVVIAFFAFSIVKMIRKK